MPSLVPAVMNALTTVDLRTMDVIGYDRVIPEPSTGMLLMSALAVGGLVHRRKKCQEVVARCLC